MLCAVEDTHCALVACYSDREYLQRYVVVIWLVPRATAAVSAHVLCTPYNHAPVYSVTSYWFSKFGSIAMYMHHPEALLCFSVHAKTVFVPFRRALLLSFDYLVCMHGNSKVLGYMRTATSLCHAVYAMLQEVLLCIVCALRHLDLLQCTRAAPSHLAALQGICTQMPLCVAERMHPNVLMCCSANALNGFECYNCSVRVSRGLHLHGRRLPQSCNLPHCGRGLQTQVGLCTLSATKVI